jgi:hypothetical protein
MTQVILMLPEFVAREAEAAGLLRPEALEKLLRAEIRRRSERPLAPDTDCPASVPQMARAWQTISRPLHEDDAVLSVDPDDYPFL